MRLTFGAADVKRADQRGAIAALAKQPFAGWMLALLAIGLAAFALWRFYDTVTGDDSLFNRGIHLVSGISYAILSVLAVSVLLPGPDEGGDDGTASLTARVMNLPGGRVLVGLAGVAVIGFGVYCVAIGLRGKFMEKLNLTKSNGLWVSVVGVVGWVGRGVVGFIIGAFVIRAATEHNPDEAKGLDGALKALLAESYGRPLLITVAAGFAAYAVLCLVEAKYRRYDS